jgi:hypothetical protein
VIQDSPQTTTPGSYATPVESTARDSKPSAFDSFETPAAPVSSYNNSPAPVSSYNASPAPVSSYKPEDTAAGNLPSDTSNYDAQIPEGIVKPKDFDTEGGDYSAPTPSPYTPGQDSDHAAGLGVNEADSKIPQGILAPQGGNTPDEPSYDENPSVTDKGKDALAGALGYPEDDGNRGYDAAGDATNTAADTANQGYEKTKDALTPDSESGYPDAPGSATETAYQAKDNVVGKANDLNNATDDSETYTQKAANTAYAAKDRAADTLGLNQPSEGPSVVDKAKDQAFGAGADTSKDYAGSAADTTNDYAGSAADTTKDYAGSAADTTNDTTGEYI